MSWFSPMWRVGSAVRFGCKDFVAHNPAGIVALAVVPRGVLQTVFFTLLGSVLWGRSGAQFAFVGSLGTAMTASTVVAICEVPMQDKRSATFSRLRTSLLPPAVIFGARAVPYPIVGLVVMLASLLIGAPLTGLTSTVFGLLLALPCYAVMAMTSTAAGLAIGALAVGKRADVMFGNVLSYLILLTAGVVVPPGRVRWLDVVGQAMPLRHGLTAVHRLLDGRPWHRELLLECFVGAMWALTAAVVVTVQVRRARVHGFDDFD